MAVAEQQGLGFERYFTSGLKTGVYDNFEWEKSDVGITDDSGDLLFVQEGVEFPKEYSHLARKIVASKYFFGERDTSEREYSEKQLTGRVSSTFGDWGLKQGYFASREEADAFKDEIAYLSLDQRMAFNSPVWFNVGVDQIAGKGADDQKEAYFFNQETEKVERIPAGMDRVYPQTSACFIQNVKDTMEDIMELAKKEALLFKYGSGTGTNLSTLRSSREKLSGGGVPSGPLDYWAFFDKVAGIVKSGGKTRRAAKMNQLDMAHPDIYEFIESKRREEEKLHILIDNGVPWKEAAETVAYQNTNISVRILDAFMEAFENDEEWQTVPVHNKSMADQMPKYGANDLLRRVAENAHFCGDPGVQFHDSINKWNTVPNFAEINCSNPCGEYNNPDNSSCNLASQNLMKFLDMEDDSFKIMDFASAVRTTAIAQDLEFDNSSFPTKEIAENSHKLRPLGQGYANLGSMLMYLGLPYDSDGARAVTGAVTALQTGVVYETSTELAEKVGPFEEYESNKDEMMNVMRMHKDALESIDRDKLPAGLEGVLDEAYAVWERVVDRGETYGFRNNQATVLAPTGTIGFRMDCDTKGVEPEIGLVQTKLLIDGGTLRLVNSTVEQSLKKLEYSDGQVEDIIGHVAGHENLENTPHLKPGHYETIKESKSKRNDLSGLGYSKEHIDDIVFYLDGYETVEGAPHIKDEHLAIFDTANKPQHGTRTISYQGHLEMMAAVQPFVSGAISKTVNLPEETSVEEIETIYHDAWKMGLKGLALYRDNCKRFQPLSFADQGEALPEPVRRKLPTTRESLTHKFSIADHEGYLTVGKFEDGTPGELFINMNKEGSTQGGLMDSLGILTSMALQYGVPLEALVKKFRHQRFEPRGLVREGHPEIHEADSVVDYIFHFMEIECGDEKGVKNDERYVLAENPQTVSVDSSDGNGSVNEMELGGLCATCGEVMVKRGPCIEQCPNCNYTDPKGCGQ
jgi:ribonucleoside-diphosphate reductase alpha chain